MCRQVAKKSLKVHFNHKTTNENEPKIKSKTSHTTSLCKDGPSAEPLNSAATIFIC